METKIKWNEGDGYITATYEGSGSGSASISSDVNEGIDREQSIKVETTDKSVSATLVVSQEGLREEFVTSDGLVFVTSDSAKFGVLKGGSSEPVETYTRLTWIEATGEQYINLNYIVQEDDVIEMYYIMTSSTSVDKSLFGVYGSVGNLWASIYGSTAYMRFGGSSSTSLSNARQRYKIKMMKESADIDGSTATLDYTTMPDAPLYLFARNRNNNGVDMYGYCRSMGFKISKTSGEVVINLKPCKRDSDGKVGMLDLVSGTFFINSGSGEDFVAGSEIQITEGYEVLDYTTFSADKLFDAGIISSDYTIEVLFERTETAKTPYLYGVLTSPHTATVSAYLSSGGSWRFGSSYKGLTTNTLKMYKVEVSKGKTVLDFTSGTFTASTFTTPDTLVVGGYRAASGTTYKTYYGLLYYFRIKNGSELLADWIPCKRLSDEVEGFWDCVTQTFVEPM